MPPANPSFGQSVIFVGPRVTSTFPSIRVAEQSWRRGRAERAAWHVVPHVPPPFPESGPGRARWATIGCPGPPTGPAPDTHSPAPAVGSNSDGDQNQASIPTAMCTRLPSLLKYTQTEDDVSSRFSIFRLGKAAK